MVRINIDMSPVSMTYEVYEGEKLLDRQFSQTSLIFHRSQFARTCEQIARDPRPLKFKLIGPPDSIWDQFEQKRKSIENYIEFKNNAYLAKYGREENSQ